MEVAIRLVFQNRYIRAEERILHCTIPICKSYKEILHWLYKLFLLYLVLKENLYYIGEFLLYTLKITTKLITFEIRSGKTAEGTFYQ